MSIVFFIILIICDFIIIEYLFSTIIYISPIFILLFCILFYISNIIILKNAIETIFNYFFNFHEL
jgi:hypothetical protein